MSTPPSLSYEQITALLGNNVTLWPLLDDSTKQRITDTYLQFIDDRMQGLITRTMTTPASTTGDSEDEAMRTLFATEIVDPILAPHAAKAAFFARKGGDEANSDPRIPIPPDFKGITGYTIGIGMMQEMANTFSLCDAVQICFGLDKPLANGGQLQLIFRGIGGNPPSDQVYMTGTPGEAGGPGEGVRIQPCPISHPCTSPEQPAAE
ncbi:hypothetical protein [Fibrella arboris]|uniref:hypothetical protein n=1 Tax=Fibrella arboris TaxID=3242486 RepID=UPI003522812A